MSSKLVCGFAGIIGLMIATPSHAGDPISIDGKIRVTKLIDNSYRVEFSGTLKLNETGDVDGKWHSIRIKLSQLGTTKPAGLNSLTQPTLKADGSYTSKTFIRANPLDVNWNATAEIIWYKNAKREMGSRSVTKRFTVP